MLRRTFFLLAALFVVSACGPNCNTPYGGYQAGVYQQPGCQVYPAQYPTTQYPYNGYPQTGYPQAGYPQTGYPTTLPYQQMPYTPYCAPGNIYCYHSEQ
jgi:replication factor A1